MTNSSSNNSSASCPNTGDALYTRLGGHAGIYAAVGLVVDAELANADIASYFFFQGEVCKNGKCIDGGSAKNAAAAEKEGHPTGAQIQACFTDLVGSLTGGPEKYTTMAAPVKVDAGKAGGGVFTCRSLTEAHRGLNINQATFNEFLAIAAGVLQPALAKADATCATEDLTTLAGALTAAEGAIVTRDGGVFDGGYPGDIDAALKLDADF